MPIVPGHTLICPKRPVETIDQLKPEELNSMLDLLVRLKEAMKKSFGAEGFNYAWNEGSMAGQSVAHLHIHLLPRKVGDSGVYEYEPRKFLYRPGSRAESPEKELVEIADLLKKHLD
jgi:diadenosine tetraphosphate (Ap4A) HIT family hydrolase